MKRVKSSDGNSFIDEQCKGNLAYVVNMLING